MEGNILRCKINNFKHSLQLYLDKEQSSGQNIVHNKDIKISEFLR